MPRLGPEKVWGPLSFAPYVGCPCVKLYLRVSAMCFWGRCMEYTSHIWARMPGPHLHLGTWAQLHMQAFAGGPGMAPCSNLTTLDIFGRERRAYRRRVRELYQVRHTQIPAISRKEPIS